MVQEIDRELVQIRRDIEVSEYKSVAVRFPDQRPISNREKSLMSVAVPINTKSRLNPAVLDKAKKMIAMVNALSKAPELIELNTEIKAKIPHVRQIAAEAMHQLATRNFESMNMRTREIENSFNQIIDLLKNKDRELSKTEINVTASHIRGAFREIGFDAIREISLKNDSVVLRAQKVDSTTSIIAEVNKNNIKLDTHGFRGSSCSEAIDKLLDKLREKGIAAQRKERVFHDKSDGGELVKEAQKLFDPLSTERNPLKDEWDRLRRHQVEKSKRKIRVC
jgi:hypothetical protein